MLQERFAPAICRQQRRGYQAAKRAHCQNQPALPLHHAFDHGLRHFQRSTAIDLNDPIHLLARCLHEWNRHIVAQTDIID